MDVNKFTESARNCVMRAQGKAVAYDHNIIKPLHLLSALSEEQMIKEIAGLLDPNWDHPWCWHGMPEEFLRQAKELWKVN